MPTPYNSAMRIHAELSGYFDWVPCPPGTKITDEDVNALRVKQMTDSTWHMKVEMPDATTHDCGVPEAAICQRLAALEKIGKPSSRDEVVVELLRSSFKHHFSPKHLQNIIVLDDGPDQEAYAAALAAAGVEGDAVIADAMERYLEDMPLQDYLNVVFKAKGQKKGSK